MEQNITESPALFNLMGWFEKNKKQVVVGAVVLAIAGVIVASMVSSSNEKEQYASQALSKALLAPMIKRAAPGETASELLKVADSSKGTSAAEQALLLAGGAYFNSGKFAEAQQSFERFVRENSNSDLLPQALYGVGATLAAQGKNDDAAKSYKEVVDRHPNSAVGLQARYSLAGAMTTQGKLEQALALYEEVVRGDMGSSLGNEAALRADELRAKLPAVIAPPPIALGTNAPAAK
jgi:TolA-binding protein